MSRSGKYQYKIVETIVSDPLWTLFDGRQSYAGLLNPYGNKKEDILLLEDRLKILFWNLAKRVLTQQQFDVIRLICEGYSQQEIADELDINQSSVTKSMHGGRTYVGKYGHKPHGGSIKKLKRYISQDIEMLSILKQIDELKREDI